MARYCFYVDGFNLYHALNDPYFYEPNKPRSPDTQYYRYRKYKWLNLRELARRTVRARDTIAGVVFFTTYAPWKWKQDSDIETRHKQYVRALRAERVDIVQGRFLQREEQCHACGKTYAGHIEKRTDVNIALRLLSDAIDDMYDRAVIISADSDLLPAIDTVHKHAPDKEVGVMFPIGRTSFDLRQKADFRFKMPERLLAACQFPDEVQIGRSTVRRPDSWK